MNSPLISGPAKTSRIFVYPFTASAFRIRPLGVRRSVPDFLKPGVDNDAWGAVWERIDRVVGEPEKGRHKIMRELGFGLLLLMLSFPSASLMQRVLCDQLIKDNELYEGICMDNINPSTFILWFLYNAVVFRCFLPRYSRAIFEHDKILQRVATKIRYLCEEINNDSLYLLARPNYDLRAITIDVFKSKPPVQPQKIQVQAVLNANKNDKSNSDDAPIVIV